MTLVVTNGLYNSTIFPLVQTIKLAHILLTDLKPVYVGILLDPSLVITLRQRYPVLLQTVPNQDLRGRLVIFLRHRLECLIVRFVIPHQRAVRLNNDAVPLAVLVDRALLAPGV